MEYDASQAHQTHIMLKSGTVLTAAAWIIKGRDVNRMRKTFSYLVFLLFLAFVSAQLSALLFQQGVAWHQSRVCPEDDSFRQFSFSEKMLSELKTASRCTGLPPGELAAVLMSDASGSAEPPAEEPERSYVKWKRLMLRYDQQGFERVSGLYGAVLNDVECFPVAADGIVYENSWMFERNYGGKRGHEGTDLIPQENLRGHYPVVSMTDGIVEKIGWLPLGGYRIGIRSPSGGYFYYAHLDRYERVFQVGEAVPAGTVLGRMGDTGYGAEGTRGRFDVHLHLGIYIRTEHSQELSVNPYWILRYAEIL